MIEQTQTTKPEYDSYFIKKERIIKIIPAGEITLEDGTKKETKAKYLVRLSEKETFFYPQNSVFPKAMANDGEKLIKEVKTLEEADFVQMSFPKDSDWKDVRISEFQGNDEQGKAIYSERNCALTGLKNHFKEETAQIWEEIKSAKDKITASKEIQNQEQTL